MRTTLDFSPLFRSSVGFDRVFDLLENASRIEPIGNWPPYDIIKNGHDSYRVTMAVAGFSQDELTITSEPNMLIVSGVKSGNGPQEYLHRGIPGQAFERRFELADHVKVAGANLHNGLLTVELQREIPEEMKPRRIEVKTGGDAASAAPQIETAKAA